MSRIREYVCNVQCIQRAIHSKQLLLICICCFCFIEIFLMTSFLPAFNTMRDGGDPGDFMENADARRRLYNNGDYQKELEYLLPRMLHLGYFD